MLTTFMNTHSGTGKARFTTLETSDRRVEFQCHQDRYQCFVLLARETDFKASL